MSGVSSVQSWLGLARVSGGRLAALAGLLAAADDGVGGATGGAARLHDRSEEAAIASGKQATLQMEDRDGGRGRGADERSRRLIILAGYHGLSAGAGLARAGEVRPQERVDGTW